MIKKREFEEIKTIQVTSSVLEAIHTNKKPEESANSFLENLFGSVGIIQKVQL